MAIYTYDTALAVAVNPHSTPEQLTYVAQTTVDPGIIGTLLEVSHLPAETVNFLFEQAQDTKYPKYLANRIMVKLASNPLLTVENMWICAKNEQLTDVVINVAGNVNLPKEIVAHLLENTSMKAVEVALRHPNLPDESIVKYWNELDKTNIVELRNFYRNVGKKPELPAVVKVEMLFFEPSGNYSPYTKPVKEDYVEFLQAKYSPDIDDSYPETWLKELTATVLNGAE